MLLFGIDALLLVAVIILLIIGILILALIVGTVIHWFPAVIAAIVVWYLAGLLWAAVAFVAVAILMIAFRRRRG